MAPKRVNRTDLTLRNLRALKKAQRALGLRLSHVEGVLRALVFTKPRTRRKAKPAPFDHAWGE